MPGSPPLLFRLLLGVFLVLASGCASARLPASPPTTLNEINDALAGRWATVVLLDWREIQAENVTISPSVTRYTDRHSGNEDSVSTARVEQIRIRGQSGVGAGAVVGALPGLIATGFGVAAVISISQADDYHGTGIGETVLVCGGLGLAVVGAACGATGGAIASPGEPYVIYRAPPSEPQKPAPRDSSRTQWEPRRRR